jgi:hypothetical protein
MRELNDFEKNTIRKIVEQNQINFVALLDEYMADKDIELDYGARTATVHFDQEIYLPNNNFGATQLIDQVLTISDILISVIGLLDYLKQNNYLKLIQVSPTPTPARFGRLLQGNPSVAYQIYDNEITELLLSNSFKEIKVEQSLVDYFNDKFLTKEEIRHKENISWAKIALVVTIVIGGLDLMVSSLDTYYDRASYYSPTKIDSTQINQLLRQNAGHKIKFQMDSIIKCKILHDFSRDTFDIKIVDK